MPNDLNAIGGEENPCRGRIQAQGGKTQQSVAWAQKAPPTKSEMFRRCDELEAKLTPSEREEREQCFADLRQFIERASESGGAPDGTKKSFPKRKKSGSDIRVDLEVIKGIACLPNPVDSSSRGAS